MNTKHLLIVLAILLGPLAAVQGHAQTVSFGEDFTGGSTTNTWYFFNGACLTAGSSSSTTSPGAIPGCKNLLSSYYATANDKDPTLVGGNSGYLGSTTSSPLVADPVGSGALRFTNGYPYGHYERGAILSANTFASGQGLQVSFKTVTYRGDSGGAGYGADGISFFLMDGSKAAGIGATGGSLAYSCSNSNANYDGLNGGYIGLGIDEFGNFLNGTNLVSGYAGSNSATGDNTAYGYGYKANRIGLRGAGSISWAALTAAYGTYRGASSPYYPSSLATTFSDSGYSCSSGQNYNDEFCWSCPSSYTSYPGAPGSGGTVNFNGTICTYTYTTGGRRGTTTTYTGPAPSTIPLTVTGGSGTSLAVSAVQQACSTGNLYNYYNPTLPVNVGPATLANPANTAGILDYAPIPNAYSELTGVTIANESATTRGQATPIFYNLKITQDGLLSLSYSTGGSYTSVIKNQLITTSNGPLPATFRFGFAGSTGGDTNVHEIMCFKAAPANASGSSATVNEKQAAKVEAGTQAYFAFYNPNTWTGTLTANTLIDTSGVVSVASIANWDASCLLSGTDTGAPSAGGGCISTNTSGPTTATPAPTSRVMLTWDTVNNVGIPFRWASLNSYQQAALDFGDVGDNATTAQYRLNYLRGDTTNEITTLGVGLYRARDSILGDIVDSSPSWVGPPSSPYTAAWRDRLHTTSLMPENTGTQSYLQFVSAEQSRLNVVYAGANDGFLHGFRAGSFDGNGNFCAQSSPYTCASTTTPNDGQEVLAYMPGSTLLSPPSASSTGTCTNITTTGSVAQNIRGGTTVNSGSPATQSITCSDAQLDYSSSQYGHNFFVDATPGTGDLFYGGAWHTWLVGGLGFGGAAIYALDITDPAANFSESTPTKVVIGEWNSSTITCATACGSNLGNTFGTPQIRRLHNGNWAAIFGNGFGSASGDAGIYIMSIDNATGSKTFYYLSTNTSGTGNGIAYTTPTDLDGDHITDYVYAGDLKGNVWRFDLTGATPSMWGVTNAGGVSINAPSSPNGGGGSAAALFKTATGQPITSQLLVISTLVPGSAPRLLIEFGTGQRVQLNNLSPATWATGQQALYGVWDWNLSAWNAQSTTQYASLATASTPLALANLQAQVLTITAGTQGTANQVVDETSTSVVCWQGTTTCGTGNTQFGWYANLPGTQEQVIFNPVFFQGAFLVNTTVPATNIPTSCTTNQDSGFTYALAVANGGVFTNAFPTFTDPKTGTVLTDSKTGGIETNATGSVYVVQTVENKANIVYQTVSGTPGAQQVNIPANTKAKRLTWIERR